MPTLYRTYRPQRFADVIGQQHITQTLQRAIESGKIAHAYLFCGPRGLGKTTLARLVAKAINCTARDTATAEPCNACESCQEILRGSSLDVLEIDAASHTGVDNVRENIVATARFHPTLRKYKVFIIDEVHMLSTSAFNALLKTLEEPPAHAVFILATTELHKVPPTIISRCQRYDFRKVGLEALTQRLRTLAEAEKRTVDDAVLQRIAQVSEGCVRDAESLLGQVLTISEKQITLEAASALLPVVRYSTMHDWLLALLQKDASVALHTIHQLVDEGTLLDQWLDEVIRYCRVVLLVHYGSLARDVDVAMDSVAQEQVQDLVKQSSISAVIAIIEHLAAARAQIRSAHIQQLPLELAVAKICTPESTITVHDSNNKPAGGAAATATPKKSAPAPKASPSKEPEAARTAAAPREIVHVEPIPRKAPPVVTEAPEVATEPSGPITATLQDVLDGWAMVLVEAKKHNHSLASALRMHKPTEIDSVGRITIPCKFQFHFERLNDIRNRQILDSIFLTVYKQKLVAAPTLVQQAQEEVEVVADIAAPAAPDDQAMDALLKAFGGQVVE